MLTKPSPDAIKMLNSIEEYFNKAFDDNKYTSLFRREFKRLFRVDQASQFSIMGSNDAYIFGLGIIDCWDFQKNIERIENKVNDLIKKKEQEISWFESIVPLVEEDKKEGKLEDAFVDDFFKDLDKVRKWKDGTDTHDYLPLFLNKLKGNVHSDYLLVQKELSQRIRWDMVFNSSNILYQQLCDWIDSPLTKKQYGSRRWNLMKEKLAFLGPDWFSFGELKDVESAKKNISEVFYPDQEKYYKQLEEWAETELNDKSCSSWICSFLWKGRTMPIRQVQVLRFKGDLEKGKAFLMSKYEEKLEWDKKKKQDRAYRHSSLFDAFDENFNSFQGIWTNLENKYSLFPVCICSNVEDKDYPKISMFGEWTDGLKIQHDTIHYSLVVENLTLSATNRFFYTYRCKYKRNKKKYIIYSNKAFEIIKEYLTETIPELSFNENIVGCITMLDYTSKLHTIGITALLSYSKDDYNPSPRILAKFENSKCLVGKGFQNSVGYRVFTNAAIFHIAKKIGYTISLPLEKTVPDSEFKLLLDVIESKQHELSFEDKYLCYFLDSSKYKFPTGQTGVFEIFRLSRRINLFHSVQHHYFTPIFQEWLFPFGKIVYQYKNDEFKKNTESVGGDFYKYRDGKGIWLDTSDRNFIFNLRTLCYLNWVFVCNDTGNIKKLSALWLFNILYNSHLEAYQKDKAFFSSLLYYELIQNERIFMIVIDKLKETDNSDVSCKYDSSSIFYHLVRYYSNGFKGWRKELSYAQLDLLNGGKKKHELLNLFCQNRTCNITISDTEVIEIASKAFGYIKDLFVNDAHPHSDLLELFKDMKPFDVPSNFRYERRYTNNYIEYNGDYSGTYVHDVMGYTNDEIDTIFDGEPDAYWNID